MTARLGQEGYTSTVTHQVYRQITKRAAEVLEAEHGVIVDAVWGRPDQRSAIAKVAEAAGVPFTGLWLEAPVDILAARVQTRGADVSDATIEILKEQMRRDVGSIDWHRVDASGDLNLVERRAQAVLAQAEHKPILQRNR